MEKASKSFALIKPPESVSLIQAYSPMVGCLLHLPVSHSRLHQLSMELFPEILRKNIRAGESSKPSMWR